MIASVLVLANLLSCSSVLLGLLCNFSESNTIYVSSACWCCQLSSQSVPQKSSLLQDTTDTTLDPGIPFLGTFTTAKASYDALTSSVHWNSKLH